MILNSASPSNVLHLRDIRDRVLYDETEISFDLQATKEEDELDYNELIDEFDEERVELAQYYLHRYKLFKLWPRVLELESDDFFVFMLIEEEIGNRQAVEQMKIERANKQHGN